MWVEVQEVDPLKMCLARSPRGVRHYSTAANIVEYCKRLVTQPPSGDNDVEINYFVSELVNNDEQTLFAADYLALKGILSLSCEEVLYLIKCKDPAHIPWIFNITTKFSPKDEERMLSAKSWAFN
ncbi:hypothetical protein M9H77_12390 [Catharanthus roseus]|uniref:Uncharacterized protein n=1 Tax=Catharanthus roseus TaxID=4058 RepID=A0ACC0BHD3_CATRO|nr:hypothetical protein M9H77_12390 [Catharanthus roseus]